MIKGDNARLDISARKFWQTGSLTFFDGRVFNPMVFGKGIASKNGFHQTRNEKKKSKSKRVMNIEHGTFAGRCHWWCRSKVWKVSPQTELVAELIKSNMYLHPFLLFYFFVVIGNITLYFL